MSSNEFTYRLPAKATRFCQFLAVLGVAALVAGLFLNTRRVWIDLFLVSNYLVGLGLAGLLLVALHHVTGARWSRQVQQVAGAMAGVLPVGAVGMAVVLLFFPALYSWSTPEPAGTAHSPLQHLWLNRPFFLIRSFVYLAVWLAFAGVLLRNALCKDEVDGPAQKARSVRWSALFLVVFGVTCWLSSYDWIMSMNPDWSSTIFGVYNFAGLFLSGIAAVILLVLWLRRQDGLQAVFNDDHLHDLGTLLFAFSSFWMYTWFCQYMLIWYVDNPEETSYLRQRAHGAWPETLYLDLALNWGIPFVVLLFRSAKRSPLVLGTVALVVVAGRWVDLALMVLPSQGVALPVPNLLEVGLFLGAVGVFGLACFGILGKKGLSSVRWLFASQKV